MPIQRGRRSLAALTLVGATSNVERMPRPGPPAELSGPEAGIWRDVTASLPADWFRPEQIPLLTQYCRHVVRSNVIAAKIAEHEEQTAFEKALSPAELELRGYTPETLGALYEMGLKTYDRLLKMQERESRTITLLATKMRLSQQSTYDKSKRKPVVGNRPWDRGSQG
jgi:hypothetical protein